MMRGSVESYSWIISSSAALNAESIEIYQQCYFVMCHRRFIHLYLIENSVFPVGVVVPAAGVEQPKGLI